MSQVDYKRYLKEAVELEERVYVQKETICRIENIIQSLNTSYQLKDPELLSQNDNVGPKRILLGVCLLGILAAQNTKWAAQELETIKWLEIIKY